MSVDMDFDLVFVGYGYALNPGGTLLLPCSGEDGAQVRGDHAGLERLFLLQHGVGVPSRHDRYVLKVRRIRRVVHDSWFVQGNRVTSAAMALSACALAVFFSRCVRWAGSHCPRLSLWARAVAHCCSSGMLGSSSHASGMSPVQTFPDVTCLSGLRSCSGHSGNGLSSYSSGLDVVAFSPDSGKGCHAI